VQYFRREILGTTLKKPGGDIWKKRHLPLTKAWKSCERITFKKLAPGHGAQSIRTSVFEVMDERTLALPRKPPPYFFMEDITV